MLLGYKPGFEEGKLVGGYLGGNFSFVGSPSVFTPANGWLGGDDGWIPTLRRGLFPKVTHAESSLGCAA